LAPADLTVHIVLKQHQLATKSNKFFLTLTPGHDVLDMDGELIGQVEGDVTEGHDGRDESLAAVGRQVVLHQLEDVCENGILGTR
jgi:hypothetical protein